MSQELPDSLRARRSRAGVNAPQHLQRCSIAVYATSPGENRPVCRRRRPQVYLAPARLRQFNFVERVNRQALPASLFFRFSAVFGVDESGADLVVWISAVVNECVGVGDATFEANDAFQFARGDVTLTT